MFYRPEIYMENCGAGALSISHFKTKYCERFSPSVFFSVRGREPRALNADERR
jgi:hypothetical protein